MARDELSDILQAVIMGGASGFSEGRKSEIEIRKDLYKERLKRALNPEESELKKAQAEYYKSRSQNPFKDEVKENLLKSLPEGENIEDYILKPSIRSVRGVPQRMTILERKKDVPVKQVSELKDIESNIYDLEKNLKTLESSPEIKKFIGPGIVQRPGAIADIIAQMGGSPKDFTTFKADVDKSFQKYRKWTTGVQAGYPELQWLVVDFPKTTDKADVFISKSLSAMETMRKNRDIFLDYLSAGNLATSKLKKLSSKPTTTEPSNFIEVTNPSGKRVKIRTSQLEQALQKGYKK